MALHHSGEPTSGVQADINASNARADIKRFITDSKLKKQGITLTFFRWGFQLVIRKALLFTSNYVLIILSIQITI